MFRGFVFLCCLYLSLTPYLTSAMTDEQKKKIHDHFEELAMECIKDFPITESDINEFRSHKMASGENAPCFTACIMKKMGAMDDKGMLQKETALDLAKKVFDDEEELKNIENYLHSCSHVNNAAVSDGEKGCERAKLSFNCMLENAAQFGFEV